MTWAVRLEGVTKAWGDVSPIRSLSLRLPQGQVVALLGRSGCGKTTLLRLMAGLRKPTEGTIQYAQKDFSVGVVFQSPKLLPWKTVQENIRLAIRHETPQRQERRLTRTIRLIGLQEWKDAYPREISGGMAQRVGLARALVARPQVLLMDEPFAALDALTRFTLQRECKRIFREQKMTVLLITHDPTEAVRMSHQAWILQAGQIVKKMHTPREDVQAMARMEKDLLEQLLVKNDKVFG